MSFAERLRIARMNSGLTQESLGMILNVSRQSITKWESGDAFPDVENLLQLSVTLGIKIDDLFSEELAMRKKDSSLLPLEVDAILEENLPKRKDNNSATARILQEIIDETDIEHSVKCGIKAIDQIDEVFTRSHVYILAGPACVGRKALALNIADNIAKRGKVLWYSMDTSAKYLYAMLLALETGIPTSRHYIYGYSSKKRETLKSSIKSILQKNLEIKEMFRGDVETIREDLSNEHEQLDLIVIDDMNKAKLTDFRRTKHTLNMIAMDRKCPVLILDRVITEDYSIDPQIYPSDMIEGWMPTLMILSRKDYYDIDYRRDDDYSECDLRVYDSDLAMIGGGKLLYLHSLCKYEEFRDAG